ncbi:MAG: glycosyltransferase family 2 protein [Nostocaceae cyanobacterium]|nr:glycosyltransferase family 2 protein [Nostocaceae cyanobacterium]
MKKVSVIIPVYGAEKYIAATVQSVLDQTYQNLEIILIDDTSPDRSIEVCQKFNDPRIKIIRHQKNRGLAGARNTGIRHAQGEYFAFLDADDIWHPEKLAKHVSHLEHCPDVGVSFSYSAFIDEADNLLGIYQIAKLNNITPEDLFCRTPIGNGSAAVFRREVFEEIKFPDNLHGTVEDCYFDEHFRESEDVECWLRIAIQTNWKLEGIPEALTLYRVNSTGLSANLKKKLDSWQKLIEKTRSYAPELMVKLSKPALAYQQRYLARRAVTLQAGSVAVELFNQAIFTHWRILIEEPQRTLVTGIAAYLLLILPKSLFVRIKTLGLKINAALQKHKMEQEQMEQSGFLSASPQITN